MNYYFEAFKKWNVLKGRATRREYWTFTLINFAIGAAAGAISAILHNTVYKILADNNSADLNLWLSVSMIVAILIAIYALIILIPSICVSVRRLHDANHSGGWLFFFFFANVVDVILSSFFYWNFQISHNGIWLIFYYFVFIPAIIISLILLKFTLSDSQPGSNKYGPNPKELLGPKTA